MSSGCSRASTVEPELVRETSSRRESEGGRRSTSPQRNETSPQWNEDERFLANAARGFMRALNERKLSPAAQEWSFMAPNYFGVTKVGGYLDAKEGETSVRCAPIPKPVGQLVLTHLQEAIGPKILLPAYLSMVARAVEEHPSFQMQEKSVDVVIMDGKAGRKKRARVFLNLMTKNGRGEGLMTETMIVYEFVKKREERDEGERWWCVRSFGMSAGGVEGMIS